MAASSRDWRFQRLVSESCVFCFVDMVCSSIMRALAFISLTPLLTFAHFFYSVAGLSSSGIHKRAKKRQL
jgi:hypothetical protein